MKKKDIWLILESLQKNEEKLSSAYHDITFGEIPVIQDTRSIYEKEQDKEFQRQQATKNAMFLFGNDGIEANKFLAQINKDYVIFNKNFPDIVNKLGPKVGKLTSPEALNFVGRYLAIDRETKGIEMPNDIVLQELGKVLDDKFSDQQYSSDMTFRDTMLKIDALIPTISSLDPSKRGTTTVPIPSTEDITAVITTLKNPDTPEEEVLQTLTEMVETVTRESLQQLVEEQDSKTVTSQGRQPLPDPVDDQSQPAPDPVDDQSVAGTVDSLGSISVGSQRDEYKTFID